LINSRKNNDKNINKFNNSFNNKIDKNDIKSIPNEYESNSKIIKKNINLKTMSYSDIKIDSEQKQSQNLSRFSKKESIKVTII